jgi:hypothetical protein
MKKNMSEDTDKEDGSYFWDIDEKIRSAQKYLVKITDKEAQHCCACLLDICMRIIKEVQKK